MKHHIYKNDKIEGKRVAKTTITFNELYIILDYLHEAFKKLPCSENDEFIKTFISACDDRGDKDWFLSELNVENKL